MLCSLFCLFHFGVSWVYPLFETFTSLKDKRSDIQWVSFWLIIGVLSYLEFNFLFFIADFCVYTVVKTFVVFWMVHPDFLGASFIYESYLAQVFQVLKGILEKTPLR